MLIAPDIAPAATRAILAAAASAGAAIPPAFPLAATVAVNPFLGQSGEDLATAAARLARVAGVRPFLARAERRRQVLAGEIGHDDLAAALAASPHAGKPAGLVALVAALAADPAPASALPTVADLLAEQDGTDWPALVARAFGLWAAGHFDRGQALWTPAPGLGAYAAWRAFATHDLTPEVFGLSGFCAHVAGAPDTPERAILRAAERLGLAERAAETVFHRLLTDLGGWAQHARYLGWQAELAGSRDDTLLELLAIRLVVEEALLAHGGEAVAASWARVAAAHAEPIAPTADDILDSILQEAAERAFQRTLTTRLNATADARVGAPAASPAPWMAAVFCIDVRSEPFRRALESLDPGIETRGFAGFFGLPLAHREPASTEADAHLPVLLAPGLSSEPAIDAPAETGMFIAARARRAWGRFRQAAVSSFAFVEAAGVAYAGKLIAGSLGRTAATTPAPAPRPAVPLTPQAKVETAAAVLGAMSWKGGWPPLVLLLGHGASVTNNPHASAYHCGACGGHTGEASARLLAALLNDPETRSGLAARGLAMPAGTLFIGGLHDTTTDQVTLFAEDTGSPGRSDLARARDVLAAAGALARAERAPRLPDASSATLARRARDWAEVRPEWGLAGCAAFVAAPREATAGLALDGRAFLHCYDWQKDTGFGTLELILTAPVVVASWISLQYFGSSVAPELFGSGNKLLHNVVGGIGVLEGNGGRLRAGLPWQAVHDGERLVHPPLRLSVLVEAPEQAILGVLARHPEVATLFDQGWLHLFALDSGRVVARYRPGGAWEAAGAPVADWSDGKPAAVAA